MKLKVISKNHYRSTNFVIIFWGLFRIQSNIWDGATHRINPKLKTDVICANSNARHLTCSEQTSDNRSKFWSNIENQEEYEIPSWIVAKFIKEKLLKNHHSSTIFSDHLRHAQNPVKHSRWSFPQKQSTA